MFRAFFEIYFQLVCENSRQELKRNEIKNFQKITLAFEHKKYEKYSISIRSLTTLSWSTNYSHNIAEYWDRTANYRRRSPYFFEATWSPIIIVLWYHRKNHSRSSLPSKDRITLDPPSAYGRTKSKECRLLSAKFSRIQQR